jgi:hypothetical protein
VAGRGYDFISLQREMKERERGEKFRMGEERGEEEKRRRGEA